jgi:hypothetical protein
MLWTERLRRVPKKSIFRGEANAEAKTCFQEEDREASCEETYSEEKAEFEKINRRQLNLVGVFAY